MHHTQALIENWMVCLSQRREVGFGAAVVDDPDVLVFDPTKQSSVRFQLR